VIPRSFKQYRDALLPSTPLVSILLEGSELIGRTFQVFLPENKYLATTVPTRNKDKLNTFCSHCWYLLQTHLEHHLEHLLLELTNLTPDPIVFSGYLWRYHTSINHDGILEDYQAIIRLDSHLQTACLVRAYIVFYSWNDNSYTVSLI